MVMDMTVLMYWSWWNRSSTLLLLLITAVVVDYCCCCRCKQVQEFATANAYSDTCCEYLRHTAAAKIAYKITRSRSIQVDLGKEEGRCHA